MECSDHLSNPNLNGKFWTLHDDGNNYDDYDDYDDEYDDDDSPWLVTSMW